jgi:hypothetical protein
MGVFTLFSDRSDCPQPPMPDPTNYSTIKRVFVGKFEIAEVKYFGCTTFNGRKLLLLRRRLPCRILDPHLLGDDHIVMARFEPTEEGWRLAHICADYLNDTQRNLL